MALSPYKSHDSPLNRSRSSSCSSPIRNRVIYHEVYSVGGHTLVRSYSCDEILTRDNTGNAFQRTKIQVSSFFTPEKRNYSNIIAAEVPAKSLRLEKMSSSPTNRNSNPPVKIVTKKSSFRFEIMIKCILLPLLTAFVIYNCLKYKECGYVWDVRQTENELKENVFGQNEALVKLNAVLNMCNNTKDLFALVFTGGVGVGKTYTSSIIRRNFPWSSNYLITYSDSFEKKMNELIQRDFASCGCNLLIVDDLSAANVNDAITFLSSMASKRKANEKVLIILIFKVHSETEKNSIVKELKESYIHFHHVHFKNLNKEVVRQCYEIEMKRQSTEIPNGELEKLIENKLGHIDIVKGPTGCKGVSEEVAYYYRKIWE